MRKFTTILAAMLLSGAAFAQIPNASFETWTTMSGYSSPTSWDNLNATTSLTSVYTCTKGMPGYAGAAYLQLTSKTVGAAVAPGVAVSGILNPTTFLPQSGFAYSARPGALTGAWQYMAFGSDQGYIGVLLSKWDTAMNMRDTIAYAVRPLTGMVMSWATFSIPLTYVSGAMPDSAIIVLSASGSSPANGSYLYVDTLAFTGSAPTGITNNFSSSASLMSISPNPSVGNTVISYSSNSEKQVSFNIYDINGRHISSWTLNATAGLNEYSINVADFAKGVYIVKMYDGQNSQVQKLIVE